MKSEFLLPRDHSNKMLGKGFQMTFENGNTISVMFGSGNYCGNKSRVSTKLNATFSNDAEIAIWNEAGDWYDFGSDTVKGYLNTNEVAEWIKFASENTF